VNHLSNQEKKSIETSRVVASEIEAYFANRKIFIKKLGSHFNKHETRYNPVQVIFYKNKISNSM